MENVRSACRNTSRPDGAVGTAYYIYGVVVCAERLWEGVTGVSGSEMHFFRKKCVKNFVGFGKVPTFAVAIEKSFPVEPAGVPVRGAAERVDSRVAKWGRL